jgi:hypothetical protein
VPSMSRLIYARLENVIAAGNDLIQQLWISGYSTEAHLDALYAHALSTCFNGEREHAISFLGSVALLAGPPTPALLVQLLGLSEQQVMAHVQEFVDARLLTPQSPLSPITDVTPVRVCHDSFRDFVVDSQRNRVENDRNHRIKPAETHGKLLDRCLWLLNEHLHQDICDIRNPGLANAEVPDLSARLAQSVPEGVRYACLFWPKHLASSHSVSETVLGALLDFCTNHLLHWLEVLSLLGVLSYAGECLPPIIAWCQVSISPASPKPLFRTYRTISRICLRCMIYHCY